MNSFSNLGKVIVGAIVLGISLMMFSQASAVLAQAPATFTTPNVVAPTGPTEGDAGGFVICGNTADNPCTIGHLFAAFVIIINYLIAMAAMVAVLAIVYAGLLMIYSQGQDQLKQAKSRFAGAVIGLVLVAVAYILINSLFSGTFSVGVCNGNSILTSPLEYIQDIDSCKGT